MSDDAALAGCLQYRIMEGKAQTIGARSDNTVCVSGIGISDQLCSVQNTEFIAIYINLYQFISIYSKLIDFFDFCIIWDLGGSR